MTLKPGEHIWWQAPGTLVLKTVLDTGEDVRAAPLPERYRREFSTAKTRWRGEGILRIALVGAPWSVWLFWEPGWQFAGWYINLETAFRSEGHHVYAEDQVLDIWVRGSPRSPMAGRTGDRIRDGRCHPSRTACHGTSTSRRLTIFSRQTCTRRSNPQAPSSATEPTGRRAGLTDSRRGRGQTSAQNRSSQA